MPPILPDIARFETGRVSRISLPTSVCPDWFKDELSMLFVPLHWREEIFVHGDRLYEALLLCKADDAFEEINWAINPNKARDEAMRASKPEEIREGLFVFETKLSYSKRQWKINCPPYVKGICDEQGRLFVTKHSLGVCVWSSAAFNQHYS